MGIIQTNQWMKKEFNRPVNICERLVPYFHHQNKEQIYRQLLRFGMFKPSRASWNTFEKMAEDRTWNKLKKIYDQYVEKWSGPEVPVFLFPIDQSGGLFFRRSEQNKSGVSFPDKMFLFLSPNLPFKEFEGLFVHEYHHVCRLKKLNKNLKDYTLLDSMIIEGLAEYAVLTYCGKEYLADWCTLYSEKQLTMIWDQYLKDNLTCKKSDKMHDDLLYGNGRIPKLAGYAVGFSIVNQYYQKHPYSIKRSFAMSADQLIKETKYKLK